MLFNSAVAQGSAYQYFCPIHRDSDFSEYEWDPGIQF